MHKIPGVDMEDSTWVEKRELKIQQKGKKNGRELYYSTRVFKNSKKEGPVTNKAS